MNNDQIAGIVRALLAAAGGYAAGHGIDVTGLMDPVVQGAIVTLAVAAWSALSKRKKA